MSTLFRKVTASVAALSIVLSVVSPVTGVRAATDSAVDAANRLAADGIIADQSKNPTAYNLGSSITRREMLKVMMNLSSTEVSNTCEGKFADLKASDWGCKYAEAALKAGFIAANKNFRPNDLVSKSEALKMIMQAKGIAKKDGVEPWQKAYVEAAVEAGVLSAAFTDYTATAKRSMVVVAADAAQSSSSDEGDDDLDIGDLIGGIDTGSTNGTGTTNTTTGTTSTGTTNTGSNVVVGTGDLEISLNPATLADGSEVPSKGIIQFAKVDFSAASSDVAVNTVEIKKSGLASVSTDVEVWFEKNGQKVSSEVSFNSEGTAVVSFSPAFVVKAGSTETLSLYVDFSAVSGTNQNVDYKFVSGVVKSSAKTVKGSFSTPKLRTTNYEVNTVTLSSVSTTSSYKANSDLIEIAGVKLENGKVNGKETTDVTVNSISFYLSGSANLTNLSDFALVRNGTTVSTTAKVDGRYLTFTMADTIKDALTATYYVKAKVAKVENDTDTYQLRIKETSDVNVTETRNGFRATISGTPSLTSVAISGGEVRFERDTAVALNGTYAPGAADVVLMKGSITAKNAVKVKDVTLAGATGVNLANYFTTVYLSIGGSVISATPSTTPGANLVFKGTVNLTGTSDVKVYGTLRSNAAAISAIKLGELTMASFTDKEFVSNQQTAANAGIGSIPAVSIKVEDSTINVTRNDGLGDTKLVKGTKGATLYGVSLSSTKGNPSNVTSVEFDVTKVGSEVSNNVYTTLYVNGTAVSSKTIDSNATVKFEGFNAKVSKDSTVNLVVKADLSDSFTSGSVQLTLKNLVAVDSETGKDAAVSSKPAGAVFTIGAPVAKIASSDNNPKASLLESGKNDYKLFAFKVTAENDNIKLSDVTLTGTNLDAFSNFRLTDVNNAVVANSSSASGTEVKFESFASDKTMVAIDKSTTFYVVADAKTSKNQKDIQLFVSSVKFTASNGGEEAGTIATSGVASKVHQIAENVLVVAKDANANKTLSNAMVVSITASGKNSVTLSGITAKVTQEVGYTSTGTVKLYKNSFAEANEVVFTGVGAKNNTIDAGSTVKFVLVVDGAVKTNNFTGTPSIDVELIDVETTEITSVKAYDNTGLTTKFVEQIR